MEIPAYLICFKETGQHKDLNYKTAVAHIAFKLHKCVAKICNTITNLKDQEVPGLDENSQLLKCLAVVRQAHHFIIDAIL